MHAGVISHAFCHLLTLSKQFFLDFFFQNSLRISNGLEPDQGRHCVGPDLGPNCLQRLSADNKEGKEFTVPEHLGTGDKNISILHLSCSTSGLQFSLVLQTHVLVL